MEPAPNSNHHGNVVRSIRETAIYTVSKIVPAIVTFASIRLFTAWYTPEEYGQYATVLALGLMVASLGTGWLQMAVLRLYPEWMKRGESHRLAAATWKGLAVSLGVGSVVCAAAWVGRDTTVGSSLRFELAGWVFILYAATSLFLVGSTFLRAARRPAAFSFFQSLSSVFRLIGGVGGTLLLGVAVGSLIAGTSIGMLISGLAVLFYLRKAAPKAAPIVERRDSAGNSGLISLFAFGFPLALGQLGSQILNISDRYMISILRGDHEAGLYAVNYDIADYAVRLVILSLMLSAYTAVIECYEQEGKAAAEKLVSALSRLFLILAAPIAVGTFFVQEDLVRWLADGRYWEGASILVWIALGDLFLGLSQYQTFGYHVGNRPGLLSWLTLGAAGVKVVLNLIFIPMYGYEAAAITTFGTSLALSAISPLLTRKHLAWTIPLRSVGRLVAALAVMAVGLSVAGGYAPGSVPGRLAIQVPLGAILYGGTLLMLGESSLWQVRGLLRRSAGTPRADSETEA